MIDSNLIDLLLDIRNSIRMLANIENDYTKIAHLLDISNALDTYIDALESKK